jgi:ribosomal protein L29
LKALNFLSISPKSREQTIKGVAMKIVLTLFLQACAKEVALNQASNAQSTKASDMVDTFVDKLLDRSTWPVQDSELDGTMLAKPGTMLAKPGAIAARSPGIMQARPVIAARPQGMVSFPNPAVQANILRPVLMRAEGDEAEPEKKEISPSTTSPKKIKVLMDGYKKMTAQQIIQMKDDLEREYVNLIIAKFTRQDDYKSHKLSAIRKTIRRLMTAYREKQGEEGLTKYPPVPHDFHPKSYTLRQRRKYNDLKKITEKIEGKPYVPAG